VVELPHRAREPVRRLFCLCSRLCPGYLAFSAGPAGSAPRAVLGAYPISVVQHLAACKVLSGRLIELGARRWRWGACVSRGRAVTWFVTGLLS